MTYHWQQKPPLTDFVHDKHVISPSMKLRCFCFYFNKEKNILNRLSPFSIVFASSIAVHIVLLAGRGQNLWEMIAALKDNSASAKGRSKNIYFNLDCIYPLDPIKKKIFPLHGYHKIYEARFTISLNISRYYYYYFMLFFSYQT